jgi:hypothetical protein
MKAPGWGRLLSPFHLPHRNSAQVIYPGAALCGAAQLCRGRAELAGT